MFRPYGSRKSALSAGNAGGSFGTMAKRSATFKRVMRSSSTPQMAPVHESKSRVYSSGGARNAIFSPSVVQVCSRPRTRIPRQRPLPQHFPALAFPLDSPPLLPTLRTPQPSHIPPAHLIFDPGSHNLCETHPPPPTHSLPSLPRAQAPKLSPSLPLPKLFFPTPTPKPPGLGCRGSNSRISYGLATAEPFPPATYPPDP